MGHRSIYCLVPLLALTGCTSVSENSAEPKPLIQAHSHNDYEHQRPLLDALDCGFCSVEADIYLVEGKLLVAHDRREQLQKVRAPTLAICARDDTVTPLYFTEELVRLIPGARAYVLPDGGHLYPNVHGAEFRRVMASFLLESR